ncbi:hypothetical protein V6N13_090673 [Hibiscus sabdariffa]
MNYCCTANAAIKDFTGCNEYESKHFCCFLSATSVCSKPEICLTHEIMEGLFVVEFEYDAAKKQNASAEPHAMNHD